MAGLSGLCTYSKTCSATQLAVHCFAGLWKPCQGVCCPGHCRSLSRQDNPVPQALYAAMVRGSCLKPVWTTAT